MSRGTPSTMRDKISFYRRGSIVQIDGQKTTDYTLLKADVWAAFKYIGTPSAGASEEEVHMQRTGKIKAEILCRFFTGIRFEDIIYHDGGKFRIYSIQYEGNGKLLKIRAELRDDDTQFGLPSHNSLENWDGRVAWPKNNCWIFGPRTIEGEEELHYIPITAPYNANYKITTRNVGFGDENLEGRYGAKQMAAAAIGITPAHERDNFKIVYDGITVVANSTDYYDVYPPNNWVAEFQYDLSSDRTIMKTNPFSLLSYQSGIRTDLPYGYFWADMWHDWIAREESATEGKLINNKALIGNFTRQIPAWDSESFRHGSNGRLEYKMSEYATPVKFWRMPDAPNNIVMADSRVPDPNDMPTLNGQFVGVVSAATYYPEGWVQAEEGEEATEEDWTAKFTGLDGAIGQGAGWVWLGTEPTAEEMESYVGGSIEFTFDIYGTPHHEVNAGNVSQTLTYAIT